MGKACCVMGCPSGAYVPSHRIPQNPVLFKKWKHAIFSKKIKYMTDEQIKKCTVCHLHFAKEDYLVTFNTRKLKRGILPSLNLPKKPDPLKALVRKLNIETDDDEETDKAVESKKTKNSKKVKKAKKETVEENQKSKEVKENKKAEKSKEILEKEKIEKNKETEKTKSIIESKVEESGTYHVALFEDLPETLEPYNPESEYSEEVVIEEIIIPNDEAKTLPEAFKSKYNIGTLFDEHTTCSLKKHDTCSSTDNVTYSLNEHAACSLDRHTLRTLEDTQTVSAKSSIESSKSNYETDTSLDVHIVLKDLPETQESYISMHLEQILSETATQTDSVELSAESSSSNSKMEISLDEHVTCSSDDHVTQKQNNSAKLSPELSKSNNMETLEVVKNVKKRKYVLKRNMSKEQRAEIKAKQLDLLRRKKKAERYAKSPAIRKLSSFLTPEERAAIKTKIQKSRYSPKVYIQMYHDIAMKMVKISQS